ncbi:MAG: flavodoxin domain-containing protein [Candidatus Bathyarchaeota archaeon]|nr:flavodoxin domain-containing protein [Candidatus Bathyarchaeota archaeon]
MQKTVVIYCSISGFTRKYARWIAEELNADIYDTEQFDPSMFANYDLVIFGGSLHAVGINGISLIKNNLTRLANKKVIVFAVGASPPRENVLDEVLNKNFTEQQRKEIRFFYLRGGFNYDKLDLPNKLLMSLMRVRLTLKRKKNRTADEVGMLAAFSNPVDFTRKENINEILEYARE